MNNELREILDNAILKLPMEQRLVFILRDVEGHSSEEAAKILKVSVAAIKSRLREHACSCANNFRSIWKYGTATPVASSGSKIAAKRTV